MKYKNIEIKSSIDNKMKSKLAIDCINKIADFNFKQNEEETTVSIIVPRQALIENWKDLTDLE